MARASLALAVGLVALGALTWWVQRDPPVETWQQVLERPVRNKYEDLAFPTSEDGWVVAASGHILHTEDGGDRWQVQAEGLGHLRSMVMLDAERGFAGTLNGTLFRTDDGGRTWNDVTATLPVEPQGFCGMTHAGEQVHLVGRFVGEASDHYRSTDGGKTWLHQDLSSLAQGLVDVLFLDATVGFIGGMAPGPTSMGSAVILKSVDGGESWREVFRHDGGRSFAWKLFAGPDRVIHAALQTQDGTLRAAKSTDEGESWQTHQVATGKREAPGVQAIGFTDRDHGWIGGWFRGLYATSDGGETWTYVPSDDGRINRFVRTPTALFTGSSQGLLRLRAPTP